MRIREAGARDALELLDLRRSVLAEGRWFISHPDEFDLPVETLIRELALLKGSDRGDVRVARVDGRMVGMVSLRASLLRRLHHVARLEVLVSEDARGGGVGRALLTEAIAWARQSSVIDKIGLAVFADNTRAIHVYESLGFVVEGGRVGEVKMADGTLRDDVLMYLWVGKDSRVDRLEPADPSDQLSDSDQTSQQR